MTEEGDPSPWASDGEDRQYNEAIPDLGCSAFVAGRSWIQEFVRNSGADIQMYQKNLRTYAGFTGETSSSRFSM